MRYYDSEEIGERVIFLVLCDKLKTRCKLQDADLPYRKWLLHLTKQKIHRFYSSTNLIWIFPCVFLSTYNQIGQKSNELDYKNWFTVSSVIKRYLSAMVFLYVYCLRFITTQVCINRFQKINFLGHAVNLLIRAATIRGQWCQRQIRFGSGRWNECSSVSLRYLSSVHDWAESTECMLKQWLNFTVGAKHGAALGLASGSAGDHGLVFQVLQSLLLKKVYLTHCAPNLRQSTL